MRTHRVVQFVAIVILLAALVLLIGGLVSALDIIGQSGWGTGWRGWLVIPMVVGTILGATALFMVGAILFFLAKIETNLSLARQSAAEASKKADAPVTVQAPAAAVAAPAAAIGAAAVAAQAVAPRVEVAAPEAVVTAMVETAALKGEVVPPAVAAPEASVEASKGEATVRTAAMPTAGDLAALRDQLASLAARIAEAEQSVLAATRQATATTAAAAGDVEAALLDADAPKAELPDSGKLPGSDDAARIAAEMAAAKPPAP